jgi:methionine-rich copper-binding protein CopC
VIRFAKLTLAAPFVAAATAAFAHAQLQDAMPPVGGTVASVSQVRLHFSEGVEPKFSSISLKTEGGAEVVHGKAAVDPNDNTMLIIKTSAPLAPGVYSVSWKAVSVDTHHTQGAFQFTVKP